MPRNEIVDQIRAAVAAVTRQHEFLKWLKEEKVGDGLVLLNNSFIFRQKLQTIKNDLYLGIPVRTSSHLGVSNIVVARGTAFNSDFKFVELKGMKKLEVQEVNPAIDQQLKQLGSIVMVLIGEVLDTVVTRAPIEHSLFSELELNPSTTAALAIKDGIIQVRSISDEEETDVLMAFLTIIFGGGPRLNSENRLWVAHPCGFVFCKGAQNQVLTPAPAS